MDTGYLGINEAGGLIMPGLYSCRHQKTYKRWRYPGVPIPHRLQGEYSNDPRKWAKK